MRTQFPNDVVRRDAVCGRCSIICGAIATKWMTTARSPIGRFTMKLAILETPYVYAIIAMTEKRTARYGSLEPPVGRTVRSGTGLDDAG